MWNKIVCFIKALFKRHKSNNGGLAMKWTADFETTTDPKDCRVWAFGICNIQSPEFFIYGNNITDFMRWCNEHDGDSIYYHNKKFDIQFVYSWLFNNGFTHVIKSKKRALHPKTFTTLISKLGAFYSTTVCFEDGATITFLDSLKIIPFSVDAAAKAFGLEETKGQLDYKKHREVGHELTREEVAYLKNDVVIMAKVLKTMFAQGLTKMTQGSNALADFKKTIGKKKFDKLFPVTPFDAEIRQSYRGGWTYCDPRFKGKDIGEGIVLDVNSLYPWAMRDKPLPYGEGKVFTGEYVPDKIYSLYIIMITCSFELKEGMLPTIYKKNASSFLPTNYLTTSGDEELTLCLTCVDLELFLEHYDVFNLTYHKGWKFKATTGLFTDYIDKWNAIKEEAARTGNIGMRTLAKLMLNSLYGKLALNPKVTSKYPYLDKETGIVKYATGEEETRTPIYIPAGTFITSWARNKTIRSAQSVYDRFLYADTDSLHLMGTELPEGLDIDPYKLGAWKHEATFTRARFIRQKSYIEEIDGELHITCAGMPSRCYENVTWDNFKEGARYGGKLQHTAVPGGVILKEIDFTIKV